MAEGINIPGVKEPIPPWVLGVGGAGIIAFIILSRQGGGSQATSGDTSGLLAAELDQRFNDLWQQLYSLYSTNMNQNPVTPPNQNPDSGGNPGGINPIFLGPPISNNAGNVHVTQPIGWSDTPIGKIFPYVPPTPGDNVGTPPIVPPPGGIISPPDEPNPTPTVTPTVTPIVPPPGTGINPPLVGGLGTGGPTGTYLDTFRSGGGMYPYYPVVPASAAMPAIEFTGIDSAAQHILKVLK